MARGDGRENYQLRPVKVTRDFVSCAEGSVLVEFGRTRVLCNASVVEGVPKFLLGSGRGWVTGEYGMLPRSSRERIPRERGSGGGRSQEISRLIGRCLRAITRMNLLGVFRKASSMMAICALVSSAL